MNNNNELDDIRKALRIAAPIAVLLLIVAVITGAIGGPTSKASDVPYDSAASIDRSLYGSTGTPKADAFTSGTGAYLDELEKELYERDPSSMGYTDADREFLRQHGLTESEARAAETVLQQHGIE